MYFRGRYCIRMVNSFHFQKLFIYVLIDTAQKPSSFYNFHQWQNIGMDKVSGNANVSIENLYSAYIRLRHPFFFLHFIFAF